MFLRQSTASQEISLGQFLDSTDGDTEEGGLTIANTDIKIRKHGTTTLANKNSGGATVISNGVYQCTLDATDTNTAGQLEIYVHVAGALAVKSTYTVLTATAFDALLTGTFNNLGGTAQTADHTAGIADIPTVSEFNARSLVSADYTIVSDLGTVQTGDSFALIGTAGAGLTNINLPNQTMDITGNITGNLSGSAGSVTAAVTVGTINANVINAASIAAAAMNGKGDWNVGKTGYTLTTQDWNTVTPLDAAGTRAALGLAAANMDTQFAASVTATGFSTFDPGVDVVANVTLVDTTTSNADMRGTDSALLASNYTTNVNIATINGVTITGDGSGTPFDV